MTNVETARRTAYETVTFTKERATALGLSSLLTTGVVAGLFAGTVFIVAFMVYDLNQDKPAIAPFFAISTVFFFDDKPMMQPDNAIVGVITHFGLSMLFGIVFALLVPMFSNIKALTIGAFMYGLLLYVVNFEFFGNLIFEWFSNPKGPNNVFALIIHPLAYGLLLVPFFAGFVYRYGAPSTARTVEGP